MADIRATLEAKSDQLNATDIMGIDLVIRIRAVNVTASKDQPVAVYFDGDNNRPWKPSKGMRRILAGAWGPETDHWIGRYAQLHFDPTVKYAGQEVGGIRVKALSDIDQRGLVFVQAISKQKREPYHVPLLVVQQAAYPDDKFQQALPAMEKKMKAGEMTLHQIIAKCQQTGQLSAQQLAQLEAVAPVVVEEQDEPEL